MNEIIINDLKLVKAVFNYADKKIVCECIDLNSSMTKTYYLPFDKISWLTHEEMFIQVMEEGDKYYG